MHHNNLIDQMLKLFPELTYDYEKMIKSYECIGEPPGVHVVFGDIFTKYVMNLAQNTSTSKKKLKMIFAFVEKIITSKDFEVRCVAEVSIIEDLIDNNIVSLVSAYIQPITLNKINEIKEKWGID